MESKNVLVEKSLKFAINVVNIYKRLTNEKKEFVLSKQLVRSGTSIGANIRESQYASSPNDFIHKLIISLKEANETEYWLEILKETEYISMEDYSKLICDNKELIKMLIASINTLKQKRSKV